MLLPLYPEVYPTAAAFSFNSLFEMLDPIHMDWAATSRFKPFNSLFEMRTQYAPSSLWRNL